MFPHLSHACCGAEPGPWTGQGQCERHKAGKMNTSRKQGGFPRPVTHAANLVKSTNMVTLPSQGSRELEKNPGEQSYERQAEGMAVVAKRIFSTGRGFF